MDYRFAGGGRRRSRPWVKILIAAVVIILAAVYAVGITLGSSSEKKQEISQSIEENRQLKEELKEKNDKIAELEKEVNDLKSQAENLQKKLDAAATPYVPPEMTEEPTQPEEIRSPREQ